VSGRSTAVNGSTHEANENSENPVNRCLSRPDPDRNWTSESALFLARLEARLPVPPSPLCALRRHERLTDEPDEPRTTHQLGTADRSPRRPAWPCVTAQRPPPIRPGCPVIAVARIHRHEKGSPTRRVGCYAPFIGSAPRLVSSAWPVCASPALWSVRVPARLSRHRASCGFRRHGEKLGDEAGGCYAPFIGSAPVSVPPGWADL
jgi:hypothetical protein